MATVNTTNITGYIVLPNDTIREKSSVIFTMTGFDTDADDNATVVPVPIVAAIDTDGSIDQDLWPNPEGVRTTFYRVTFSMYNGTNPILVDGGLINVPATGGPYDLNDLLPIAPPSGATVAEYIAQLAAAVAEAEAAAEDAVEAASLQKATRAALLVEISGNTYDEGRIAFDGLVSYVYSTGATTISDMPNWLPYDFVTPNHYATNTTPGTTDMSAAINAASAYVFSLGGGLVRFFGETYAAKELLINSRTVWMGVRGTTKILRLDSADTYLLASASYVNNETFVNTHIATYDIIFDGNKDNNTSGHTVIMSSYRYISRGCSFPNSTESGLFLASVTLDGVTSVGVYGECMITQNDFDHNDGPGLYLEINVNDTEISENRFNTNGGRNEASLYAEKCVGHKITDNQIYNGGYHCMYLGPLGRSIVTGNHCDLEGTEALSGDRIACIWVDSIIDYAPSTVTNNILHIGSEGDSSVIDMHGIVINANSSGTVLFGANAIDDDTTQKDATALYAVPAAAAGLDNITWLQDATRDIDQGTPLRLEWTKTQDSGSNANGSYTRFYDGTMICHAVLTSFIDATDATGSIFQTTTEETWTYPEGFVNADVAVSFNPRGDNSAWGKGRPNNATSAKMRLFSAVSLGTAQTIDATAIGRWKA